MRTTVDIPDYVMRRAKATAALNGSSLKQYLVEAIEARLEMSAGNVSKKHRVTLPLVRSKSPGAVALTADGVARALEAEDLRALARH